MSAQLLSAYYRDLKIWAKKHKKALWVTAGVVGAGLGSYLVVSSLKASAAKAQENNDTQLAQLRQEAADLAEAQLQNHFETIQRIADTTTLPSVLPQVKRRLFDLMNLSSLTEKLISGKGDPETLTSKEKLNLWQDLKVQSFTRAVCAMWSLSLLELFIRTQLNILGRHLYYDTARDLSVASIEGGPLSMSSQHKFIALANFLPRQGLDALTADIHAAANAILRNKPLKDPYTVSNLREVFENIRLTFCEDHKSWVPYLLPEDGQFPEDFAVGATSAADIQLSSDESPGVFDGEKLEKLMSESRSVISSNEFADVLGVALDAVLDGVIEDLSRAYRGNPDSGIPLAKLLPPIASAGAVLMEHGEENRFIQIFSQLPQIRSFCAMVYSSGTGDSSSYDIS